MGIQVIYFDSNISSFLNIFIFQNLLVIIGFLLDVGDEFNTHFKSFKLDVRFVNQPISC